MNRIFTEWRKKRSAPGNLERRRSGLKKVQTPPKHFLFFVFIFSFVILLQGQDYEKMAPKLPEPAEEKPLIESSPQKLPGDGTVVVKELRAMVFLKGEKKFHKNGLRIDETQKTFISADELPVLQTEEFRELMQPYLGKPADLKTLQTITQEVIEYYREKDQPVVWVCLPQQNITTGVVQFIVAEAKMGAAHVEGQQWIDPNEIRNQLRIRPGELVRQNILLADIQWMNRNPFRQVTAAYKAGKELETTDIHLKAQDRFPARFYTGYENTGNDLTGKDRWYGGFNWGDAFGITNNLFSYQYTTSSDFDGLQAHSASDIFPLPWRHLLSVFGSYDQTQAELTTPMELHGKSWNLGTRYIIPLPQIKLERDLWLEHELQTGFDFKQSNNDLDFGGALVSNTLTDINQFNAEYHFTLHDPAGATFIGAALYQSPGGWSDNNKDWKFQTTRALSQADYIYTRFEISRQTQLPWKISLHNQLIGQWSNANLLASEQLGLGGRDTIRGYQENETRGDEGWYTRNELHITLPSLGELFDNFGCPNFNDHLILLAFWDYGIAQNKHLPAGENRDTELSSLGPGLRYTITPHLSILADYGFQLLDPHTNSPLNSNLHLSITLSY